MGCFLACFGSSKDRRRKCRKQQHHHKKHNKVQPRYQRNATEQDFVPSVAPVEEQIVIPEKPVIISTVVEEEIQEEAEEKAFEEESTSANGILRKRVTFDSNVRTYEPVSVKESTEFLRQEEDEQKEDNRKQEQSDASSEASSVTSSSTSYPSNHRYQNCRDSDDELDMEDQSDSDSDDEEDDYENEELDYGDMYDDPSSRFASAAAYEGKPNVRDRSGYVHPVLNPVENLSQWKAAKCKKSAAPQSKPCDKENHEQEPSFKVKKSNKEEVAVAAVDASLSNWLSATSSLSSDCCTTPLNKQKQQQQPASTATLSPPERSYSGSPNSFEDRPILGALTVEEIRQMSATNSPMRKSPGGHSPEDKPIIGSVGSYWSESDHSSTSRKSPGGGHSPDDMPIIGSVGSYWSESDNSSKSGKLQKELSFKGIPNTTSKYREDKRVNWHSTPFETRLERALKNGGRVDDAC
ncbi:Protein JASON [Linum grandiflorum]